MASGAMINGKRKLVFKCFNSTVARIRSFTAYNIKCINHVLLYGIIGSFGKQYSICKILGFHVCDYEECCVRIEVFKAVTMKNGVFLDVEICGSC
jgi:hypothetical protein